MTLFTELDHCKLIVVFINQIQSLTLCYFSENVRLGDYDLSLSKSCAGRHCGNPMRINEIDEIIPHESFNHRAVNRMHDIGLVRLKRAVQYTSKYLRKNVELRL